jgi:hypothetical protein
MIRGRVQNGVVVLEGRKSLREGLEVAVEPLPGKKTKTTKRPTVSRALAALAGRAKNLSPDASRNIDHRIVQ